MLAYDMTRHGTLPLYEYLYRCIRDDIANGVIPAESRLPSKRGFARQLGVGLVTVESAYAQLVAEGYVVSRERRGYYVANLPQMEGLVHGSGARKGPFVVPAAQRGVQEDARGQLEPAKRNAAPSLKQIPQGKPRSRFAAGAASSDSLAPAIADFSHPATPEHSPAAALWGRALRDALAHEPDGVLYGPQPPQGSERLRSALAAYLRTSRGMVVDPQCLVIGAGAQMLYVFITQLLGQDRVFAVEDPGYGKLAEIYRTSGTRVRFVPLDREGVDVAALRESGADVVHIMPSHQFPTGRVTSISRRYELLGWAAQQPGRFIVEDDYDCEFRLAGMPIPPLAGIDAQGSVIYVSTFSKSLSSALRMAYMVLPPSLMDDYRRRLGFYANTVSMVNQVALARLLESGEYERHLNRYRKRQRDIRDALVAAIRASAFGAKAHIEEADSGLHFVLALDSEASEQEIAQRARQRGVVLAPLSGYVHDVANAPCADGRQRFVMQYEGLNVEAIPQVVDAIAQAAFESSML